MDIRHIKITSAEGLFRINDKKAFKGLIVRTIICNLAMISNHQWEQDGTNLFPHIWKPDCLPAALGDDPVLPAELLEGVF